MPSPAATRSRTGIRLTRHPYSPGGSRNITKDARGYIKNSAGRVAAAGEDSSPSVSGVRLIEAANLASLVSTGCPTCTQKTVVNIVAENKIGLQSTLTFKCEKCENNFEFRASNVVHTGGRGRPVAELNARAVLGALASGMQFGNLDTLLGVLNSTCMTHKAWDKLVEGKIRFALQKVLARTLKEAHRTEHEHAVKNGAKPDRAGRVEVPTLCDGCWAKRSKRAGHGSSKLGVGFVMGAKTHGILGYGIKQSYCPRCAKAKRQKVPSPCLNLRPGARPCPKNWNMSSKAMEDAILASVINELPEKGKIKASHVIMDGDATVAARCEEVCSAEVFNGLKFLADLSHSIKNVPDKLEAKKKQLIAHVRARESPLEVAERELRKEKLKKADLVERCKQMGLDSNGVVATLISRIATARIGQVIAGLSSTMAPQAMSLALPLHLSLQTAGPLPPSPPASDPWTSAAAAAAGSASAAAPATATPATATPATATATPATAAPATAAAPPPPPPTADALCKSLNHTLTLQQNLSVAYYCSTAIKQNKGNKDAVAAALRVIPDHLFNDSHAACGPWCRAKTDTGYKPFRLGRCWFGTDIPGVSQAAKEMWKKSVTEVIHDAFLKPNKLEEIYMGVSSSPIESLNNVVSSKANKRLFLGRSFTWQVLVMIAMLSWELGPNWIVAVLHELGFATPGELLSAGIFRWDRKTVYQKGRRALVEYKLYCARLKAKNKGSQWVDAPTLRYIGGSACVGAGTSVVVDNPDDDVPEDDETGEELHGEDEGAAAEGEAPTANVCEQS